MRIIYFNVIFKYINNTMSRKKINLYYNCIIRKFLSCLIYNAENFPVFSFHFTNKYHKSMINRNSRIDPP